MLRKGRRRADSLRAVRQRLTQWLATAHPAVFAGFAIASAFSTYFCMYAFRKPFSAAAWDGEIWGLKLKIALIISQILGYALSKFIGIKAVSEVERSKRALVLLGLVGVAQLALVAVGLLPPAGKVVAMFFNGLPLGMVWGLTFSFLEGRKTSEFLGAGMSTSYIVASGQVKAVGKWLMDDVGVPEAWMPATTGLLFALPFVLAVYLLSSLPPPTQADEAARTHRDAMDGAARKSFFWQFAPGLTFLTILYVVLTAFRDFRDNFQVDIFTEIGMTEAKALAQTENYVAVIVLAVLAAIFLVKNNRAAFFLIHGVMIVGAVLVGTATLAYQAGMLDGFWWFTLVGTGLYLAYVPFGCVLFDRLIAASRTVATSVFMIYVTDAMGYAGSVGIQLYKNFFAPDRTWLSFFLTFSYATAAVCTVMFVASALYFTQRLRPSTDDG